MGVCTISLRSTDSDGLSPPTLFSCQPAFEEKRFFLPNLGIPPVKNDRYVFVANPLAFGNLETDNLQLQESSSATLLSSGSISPNPHSNQRCASLSSNLSHLRDGYAALVFFPV